MYEDNIACIKWTNSVIGGRGCAKQIDIRKHFAHEAAQLGYLRLKRVSTTDQLANVFTIESPRASSQNSMMRVSLVFAGLCGLTSMGSVLTRGIVILSASSQGPRRPGPYEGCFAVARI